MGLTVRKKEVIPDKPPLNNIMENLELEDFTPQNMISEWEKTQFFNIFRSYGDAGKLHNI